MSMAGTNNNSRNPQNPYTPVTTNDLGEDLVEVVIKWYQGHRAALSAGQQTAVITAITSILNGTTKV